MFFGEGGIVTFNVLEILDPVQVGAPMFNYFFTLIMVFGFIAWGFGMLCKLLQRA